MEWLWVPAVVVIVLGLFTVYGLILRRRMTPAEREADALEARHELFQQWYRDPGAGDRFTAKMAPDRAAPWRREFDYYRRLRDNGMESSSAFAAAMHPLIPYDDAP